MLHCRPAWLASTAGLLSRHTKGVRACQHLDCVCGIVPSGMTDRACMRAALSQPSSTMAVGELADKTAFCKYSLDDLRNLMPCLQWPRLAGRLQVATAFMSLWNAPASTLAATRRAIPGTAALQSRMPGLDTAVDAGKFQRSGAKQAPRVF